MTPVPKTDPNADGAAKRLLPAALLDLPLAGLPLSDGVRSRLRGKGMLSVADALGTEHKWLTETEAAAVRTALTDALGPALGALAASRVYDGPALRARLLAPFRDADQRLLAAAVGVDEPPQPRQILVRLAGDSELDDCLQVLSKELRELRMRRKPSARFEKTADGGILEKTAADDGPTRVAAADFVTPRR